MFIKHPPHLSSENIPERNWRSREATSETRDYCRQQQKAFNQPSQLNYHQQYLQNRTSKTLLCLINMEVKNNIITVTFIVEYQYPPKNMFS